jgi:chromosome segregation protein
VQLREIESRRAASDAERQRLRRDLHDRQVQLREAVDEQHAAQMHVEKISLEREQLAVRLREDYGIDLSRLDAAEETAEQQAERAEIDAEIAELRQKLGSIGTVNMDALEELDQVEARFQSLDSQYQDLVRSKEALEKIIQRINQESRRLFLDTLAAIRENFQQLFRQTFGGGRADIILESDVDVLDAGVEIVATPPGKPEFNNSLLSGGEKALTAVSLLMAIFKFRPSPFCVLDEVDAPFDEANIGRFIDVLKSFLGWTKFIIVTHSKKTMTAATTLYGVTMQESGISKRVSVRFEDVGEDGAIHRAADADDSQRTVA